VLALAGLFPFGRLKYHCPDKCRTPLGFVSHHWGGRTPLRDAFRLGLHHGACCVGCCWALMLLMFVVGTGSVGWMLAHHRPKHSASQSTHRMDFRNGDRSPQAR